MFIHVALARDRSVIVVWSESLDNIIPSCRELEDKLIKLLWKSRPGRDVSATPSIAPSGASADNHRTASRNGQREEDPEKAQTQGGHTEKDSTIVGEPDRVETRTRRNWYGKKITTSVTIRGTSDDEESGIERRPQRLFAPVYNGLAAGLALGETIQTLSLCAQADQA